MATLLKEKIRKHLAYTGQSIAGFERLAGLKINVVRNILNDLSLRPTAKTLTAIAKAMNCSVPSLLGTEEATPERGDSPMIQHPQLMVEVLHTLLQVAQEHQRPLTVHKACLMLDEMYTYMANKNPPALDKDFICWFMLKAT